MINIYSQSGQVTYGIKYYTVDTEDEKNSLPTKDKMGSKCYVIESETWYILNGNEEWVPFVGEDSTADAILISIKNMSAEQKDQLKEELDIEGGGSGPVAVNVDTTQDAWSGANWDELIAAAKNGRAVSLGVDGADAQTVLLHYDEQADSAEIKIIETEPKIYYYSTLAGAVSDSNAGTVGTNADASQGTAVVSLYVDENGVPVITMTQNAAISAGLSFTRDAIFNLNGKKLTANLGNPKSYVYAVMVSNGKRLRIIGEATGSAIEAVTGTGTAAYMIYCGIESYLEILGGAYAANAENTNLGIGVMSFGDLLIRGATISATAKQVRGVAVGSAAGGLSYRPNTIIEDTEIIITGSGKNNKYGVDVQFANETLLDGCTIAADTDAEVGATYGIYLGDTTGSTIIRNTEVTADSSYAADGSGSYIVWSTGVYVSADCTYTLLDGVTAKGTHAAAHLYSATDIVGGSYSSAGHGVYFSGTDATHRVKGAEMDDLYVGTHTNTNQNHVGAYIGGSSGATGISVYADDTDVSGSNYSWVLRNGSGEHDNALYISNSNINNKTIRIDDTTTLLLYLGEGNSFDANDTTRPANVVETGADYTFTPTATEIGYSGQPVTGSLTERDPGSVAIREVSLSANGNVTVTDYELVQKSELSGGSVTVDAALSASSENPVQNKAITNKINQMDSQLTDVKSQLDEKVSSKYETVNPKNWLDLEAIIDGEVLANGTVQSSTTRFFTDYIPVSEGDKVRAFRFSPISSIYKRHICLYDVEKNVVSGGSDSSSSAAFTIPSGVSFVRVTLDKNILTVRPMIVLDGEAPTTYSAYFEPHEELAEDFLTPESEAAVQKIIHGTLTTAELANKYACAFVPSTLRQTVGLPETWYYASLANPLFYIEPRAGVEYMIKYNDRVVLPNNTAFDSVKGYTCHVYDMLLNEIGAYTKNAGYGYPRKIVAENLANCSCLVIGDSTVNFGTMTQYMLDYFTSKSKTLTLLGTRGSGDNRHEGRAGWKATDYLTNKTYEGVVNPFYNPSTETFDFAYYMTNQGYSAPDFVVIQLGINDLNNYGLSAIEPTWAAIKTMIDSVRAYNSGIKILLNLPTTPNSDQSKHSVFLPSYQNRVVKYNEYAITQCLALYGSNVRPTYCHLILDPATDIRDNVHPTNAGFEKMAKEVINQINCWQNGA